MQDFSSWTLDTVRKIPAMAWMEEKRFEWLPIAANALQNLVDTKAMIVIGDEDREWFVDYLLNILNNSTFERPLLPVFKLDAFFPKLDDLDSSEKLELLDDMLTLLFPNGYFFFYVGSSKHKRKDIARVKDDSMIWLLDEREQNSLYLGIDERKSDFKLIQLAQLFEMSVEAMLFGEVDLQGSL